MKILLISCDGLPVYLETGLPANYHGENLHGVSQHYDSPSNGLIVLQEKKSQGFLARLSFFKPIRKFLIRHIFPSTAYLKTIFSLGDEIVYSIEGYGKLHLKKGEYFLVPKSAGNIEAELEEGKEYRVFESIYQFDEIKGYEKIFKSLESILLDENGNWKPVARMAGERALDYVREITHSPFGEEHESEYQPHILKQLFFLIVIQADAAEQESMMELDAAYALKNDMLQNLGKKPAMSKIAGIYKIKPGRLRKLFYKIFNEYPATFIKRVRMEKAWVRITTTDDPIKVIATDLGFHKPQSFSTKFKETFGMKPVDARNLRSNK